MSAQPFISQPLLSVEEYLASSYEPDCDYIDGHLEERNLGEWAHANLQLRIGAYLLAHYDRVGVPPEYEFLTFASFLAIPLKQCRGSHPSCVSKYFLRRTG
jgi:Uma2 family endonuclease